ncbi:MAG: hypothetical protein VX836_11330 [Pseudomonadota bacterium]|jgi:hypothetical protein|nr:hypothetical protein [Pseudomonadota bacterium]
MALVLQEVLNQSQFRWRRVLWDYIDALKQFLNDGGKSHENLFLRTLLLSKEQALCEPIA